ncbi:MAG TPA: YbhB/YbcL family Raf kinase inhibitor-like protein, partial [Anaerolineales bacterium]|nr:YbhB/YbcL family Raf kinase inhibitor-like protein [Anaerolineales bacterium]
LSKEFTCDGSSATLPLSWSGAPTETKSFAVVMHHIPGPGDSHWYWVVYNIPADILSLEKNSTGIGTLGTNSVNGQTEYAPPCSKGPGEKVYTYTVYALSAEPQISLSASQVSREVLLDAIQNITLASAALNVTYTR